MASTARNLFRPLFSRLEAAGFWCVRAILYARGRDITETISGERVLVIAPHEDDEVLGAGVAVLRLVERGKAVHITVVTDGRNSHSSPKISKDELAAMRKQEMIDACGLLGVPTERVYFGPCEDRFVGDQMDKAEAFLRGLVQRIKPDLIISPSGIDRHFDHHAIALIVAKLAGEGVIDCPVYEYPVWFYSIRTWVNPDRLSPGMVLNAFWKPMKAAFALPVVLVRTAGYLDRKRTALAAHRSQMQNLTGEATWLVLPEAWLKSFFTKYEMFFPLQVKRASELGQTAPTGEGGAAHV